MGFIDQIKWAYGFCPKEQIEERATSAPAPEIAYPPARSFDVTTEQALAIGAVARSVQIICTNVSQMELGVFRDEVQIDTPTLIRQPQVDTSMTAFLEESVFSLAVHGNAYWRVFKSGNGQVSSLQVLDPTAVGIRRNERTNNKVYYIGTQEFAPGEIKHLKLTRQPGHDKGYGPLQLNRGEVASAVHLRAYVDAWFDNKAIPTGVLTTSQPLNAEEAKAYKEAFEAFTKNGGGTVVLSNGMTYEPVTANPKDTNFVEVQRESTKSIARMFGIPSTYLLAEMTGTSQTYTNMTEQIMNFIQNTLTRYMNEIESALSECLPRGQQVQFIEESLLRMDLTKKWQLIKTQVDVGYTSGDEIRRLEGKEPLNQTKEVSE